MMKCNRTKLLAIAMASAFLGACGGGSSGGGSGGGSGGDSPESSTPIQEQPGGFEGTGTGVFLDSPVENLSYSTTSGLSGTTNAAGEFEYAYGDVVTFSVGGSKLGSTLGGEVVTPLNMVANGENPDKGMNILRLLQSLDADGNLDNGISISENVANVIASAPIDFDVSGSSFENSSSVIAALGEVGLGVLLSESDANNHFQSTLNGLADNEVDMRGTWSDVWTNPAICPGVTAVGTRTYTNTGITFSGEELSTRMVDKGARDFNGEVILEPECFTESLSGTLAYSDPEMPADFCGPTCTLAELNKTVNPWEGDSDTYVALNHVKGSDILTRTKTQYNRDGSGNKILDEIVSTISYRQTNYALDMTGSWSYTQMADGCAGGAQSTVTFTENGLSISGEAITSVSGSLCLIEPINVSYTYEEAPAQFCGPICSFEDLNDVVVDSQGDTLAVFHAKDSDKFTVIKGDITATAVRN